ncbi:unnamed protein product [Aphanomyces euteiches]|uniref:MATE efflux family protein n=1 Tax=Aphanomyces euteiches TaxID=100861 RepID=A0A6G0XCB9_9STRA|nr:hypothetical protein Ae201684_006268 [Aphanomyces euteiches]
MQPWLARWLYGPKGTEKARSLAFKMELFALIKISAPTFLTALSACAISLVDHIVAGHLGTSELTAVAYSRMLLDLIIIVFSQGFCEGTNALCSQAFGAKNYKSLGRYFQLGSFCLILASFPIGALSWNAGYILYRVGIPSHTAHLADLYRRYCIIGLMSRLLLKNMQSYFQAQHIVVPAAVISILFVGIDILIKITLTFGWTDDWRGLGFIGIPLATSATYWLLLLTYTIYMFAIQQYHKASWCWDCGQVFENAQLQVCAVVVAMTGQAQLAAHNSMLELFLFVTSPIYGLMTGSTTRIAMHLGGGQPLLAQAVSHLTLACIMTIAVCTSLALIFTQSFLGRVFSKDPQVVYYAVLNAQSRTLPVIIGFFVGAWLVGVPVAYFADIRWGWGLIGVWMGISLGYLITMAFGAWAVLKSDWENEAKKAVALFKKDDVQESSAATDGSATDGAIVNSVTSV